MAGIQKIVKAVWAAGASLSRISEFQILFIYPIIVQKGINNFLLITKIKITTPACLARYKDLAGLRLQSYRCLLKK
jgi:hypothetical protein